MLIIFFILAAYLLGSISSAVVISKMLHLPDPRTQGSGNPGATNVLRLGGKKAAILTLFFDVLKGMIPVFLAKYYKLDDIYLACIALAVFIGHLYPVFFHFKGGKGVATALGCWLVLSCPVGITLIITWLITAIIFRYSSLAALISALLAPVYAIYFAPPNFIWLSCLMSALLIYRHANNIRNLMAGKERKIGRKDI